MNLNKIARKGLLGILIVMLTAQGWLTGWSGVELATYAAGELTNKGIVNTVPGVNAKNVDGSTPLVIEFARPVQKATGTVAIKRVNDDTVVASIPVSSNQVIIGTTGPITSPAVPPTGDDSTTTPAIGQFVTITPGASIPGGKYYVQIDAGAFVYTDSAEPADFVGLDKEWTFDTDGVGKASITNKTPQNAAFGVTPASSVSMTFDKPVGAGVGTLQIFQGNATGTPFEEIAIGSSLIKGLGTRTITIDPVKNFNSNNTYYIVMPEGFLRDLQGNDISAISGMDWGFTVQSDPSALTVTGLTPNNGTTNAALNSTLTVTFSKELDPTYRGQITLKKSNGTTVASTTTFSLNNRQLIVTPTSSLENNTNYVVDIPANTFRDQAGNTFAGLNGSTSWAFKTISRDTTAPVLKTSKMHDNATIRLTYDKWLSSTSPLSSSYTVTVNGENRSVSTTYISGDSLYVVLGTGVAVGQVVRIAYAPGTTGNRVTDQSSNAAAAFGARDVENGLDSVMSKPREGNAYYSTITLYYPETVYITSSDAARQFSVTADQSNVGINSISINGSSVVTLNLSRSITDGEVVRVAYTPGAWPVKDTRGQALAGFSGFYVRNSIDTKPPEFKSAEVSGNKLWIRYNEPLNTTNKPTNSQYSVLVDGKPVYVNDSVIEDDLVTLTLASAVKDTQNISLSYVPGSLRLTDLNNNPAGYLNLTPVTYTYGNGKILSATIQGDTVQINFRDAIQAEAALTLPQFSVVVNSSTATILSATASGSVVTLKLDTSTIGTGSTTTAQTGTVSYVPGAVPIRDASSVTVPAFGPLALQQTTNTNVNNNQTGSRPVWVTEMDTSNYGQPLLVMNNNTASAVPAMSHFNRSTRQFNVDGTKLIQSFEYASASGKLNQPIVFEIPDSESSAFVGFPLNALTQVATSYRTGTIGVKYGDRLWTVPLANLDLAAMSRSLGTIGASTVITPINTSAATGAAAPSFYIQLETVPVSSSGTMESLIAGAKAQKLANSTDVYLFAINGSSNQHVEQKVKSQLAMQLAANTPSLTSGFAFVDPVTFKLSNVPSSFKNIASGVVIQGQLNGNQEIVPINNVVSYPDTASHWASEVIKELSAKWIISAPNGSYYRPNENISRAEFAELVARGLGLSGEPTAASRFPDVRSGSITSAYIGAAAEAGIITGNTDGTFKPDRPITREQMAIMMVRALNYGGKQTVLNSSSTSILSKFNDNKKIQSKDSVAKAVQEGIIQGMTSRTFEPQGNATRAQAAVMLKRVLDKLGYL
ncbi:putative repeat protein (TIGR02059 family) [Paenibacillus amylolyticus]|uniref:Repeat protein (TIGR02059 family) n=1 Tax=Paenibacillus amylolyticus TaxID=1451 RepID=A0AAP5H7B4_PAEAM|nr:SwmB domain-containing protein [Paenibacillus amylolyticus]MDR6726520.1 putative repeat protein (TIGR02059 family) [Paenibacillus amylolyticus]